VAGDPVNISSIKSSYDIVVAGGGITGAGVFHEAARRGFKVLLLEANDFAWGTSSRSSKMVHGGLRYLKQGKFMLTRAAVKERENLMHAYDGLVEPLDFIMPLFDKFGPGPFSMKVGLTLYSFMAKQKQHRSYTKKETLAHVPGIRGSGLVSAVGFKDAQVDDARLVLRLIDDARSMGGTALNYSRVAGVSRDEKHQLTGVIINDETQNQPRQGHKMQGQPIQDQPVQVQTKVLINATGAFAEQLHPSPDKGYHIRPLRGSHLVFETDQLTLDRVISFIHPQDFRPVFLFPWEGRIILGTTDVDHDQDLNKEPSVTRDEVDYLMKGVSHILPDVQLSLDDCVASIAGVRPVLSKKKKSASQESREHVVWKDKGLVTVTGGKLTTFRLLAKDALKAAGPWLPAPSAPSGPGTSVPCSDTNVILGDIDPSFKRRLLGRYGACALNHFETLDRKLFKRIGNTHSLWAELAYAAGHEDVRHLDDLLLRRLRIGLLLKDGGAHILDRVEEICRPYLDWDQNRWEQERNAYLKIWQHCYSPPGLQKEK